MAFDYSAPAELFMQKRKGRTRQPLGYRRFATAAEAIRFMVEKFPPCARSARGCRLVMNASIPMKSSACTRAAITHSRAAHQIKVWQGRI